MKQRNEDAPPLKLVAAPPAPATSGGNGGGTNDRLAEIRERLSALATRAEYLATKADVQSLRMEIQTISSRDLRWLIGILVTVIVAMSVTMFKTFFISNP